ncbi:MAG: ferrochelatase [Candidatus Pseudothioglobus sp.]
MYQSSSIHESGDKPKIGILLSNLGTPDAPTKKAVKPFLRQFLSDTRVIEPPPPKWIWQLILNVVILNLRPRRSAKLYKSVWDTHGEGSPLLSISKKQKNAISLELENRAPGKFIVALGMCYGNPSMPSALSELEAEGCNKILVLPLYPQYAASSTGSVFDAASKELSSWRNVPDFRFISSYNKEELYIQALANSVKEYQTKHGKPDFLLMSYHGIPKRYFDKGDNYPCQCCKTTYLLASKLDLKPDQYKMTFQSRLGVAEWMKDYTDETLKSLPAKGIKNVQVICPGFSADCLETVEEISEENKKYFMTSGGESFGYIPALNDRQDHIDFLTQLLLKNSSDWIV